MAQPVLTRQPTGSTLVLTIAKNTGGVLPMFALWPKKKPAFAVLSGPRFAVMQEDTVVGMFSREQRPNAITVASVIARATGRDTVVYEMEGQAIEAEIVGKKINPQEHGWSWVFFAPQTASCSA